jgi:hypothetical protein
LTVLDRKRSGFDSSALCSVRSFGLVGDTSLLFAGFSRGDDGVALETKYLVANPIFAPGGHRRRSRRYSPCFAEKSVPMKS